MYRGRYGYVPIDSDVTHDGETVTSHVPLILHRDFPLARHVLIIDRSKLVTDDLRHYASKLPSAENSPATHETALPKGAVVAKLSQNVDVYFGRTGVTSALDHSWAPAPLRRVDPYFYADYKYADEAAGAKLVLTGFHPFRLQETRTDELTVIIHGLPHEFISEYGESVPAAHVAAEIQHEIAHRGLPRDIPIRLASCWSGACRPGNPKGAAQQLADVLGNEVRAPTQEMMAGFAADPNIPAFVMPPTNPSFRGPRWRVFRPSGRVQRTAARNSQRP
jgi:hypothetical protein